VSGTRDSLRDIVSSTRDSLRDLMSGARDSLMSNLRDFPGFLFKVEMLDPGGINKHFRLRREIYLHKTVEGEQDLSNQKRSPYNLE
jgi:hypothetical protein